MELRQAAAIAIIVLMIASVIGYTVFFTSPQDQPGPEPPPLPEKPVALRFKADNIDANIVQLLPSIRIGALTTEVNINEIDKRVRGFAGVKNVISRFRQPDQAEIARGLFYVADVSFSPDVNRHALLAYLSQLPVLSSVDALSFALAGVPKKVTLVSESDLNITRHHEFSDTVVQAFVRIDANTNEQIKLNLSVTFSGNNASEIVAFQSFDAPLSLEQKSTLIASPVHILFPELLVQASIDSAELSDLNALKAEFLKAPDINGVDFSLPAGFNAGQAVSKPVDIAVKLSLVSAGSKAASLAAEKVLRAKNASLTIQQPGEILLSSVADQNANKSFEVPNGRVTVFLKPGHAVGENAKIELVYIASQDKILSISGRERE